MAGQITTHVLDTSKGSPAVGVPVILECWADTGWEEIGSATTDADGRVSRLAPDSIEPGLYRLTFDTAAYFDERPHFHPIVKIVFRYETDGRHYHVPLLLSPFGYTTYRGS